MRILQVISEHKKYRKIRLKDSPFKYFPTPIKRGYKRVEAIIEIGGYRFTKHIDIPK